VSTKSGNQKCLMILSQTEPENLSFKIRWKHGEKRRKLQDLHH